MNTILKIAVITALLVISFQDIKERKVYLWLFLVTGVLLGVLHYQHVFFQQFTLLVLINCSIVLTIIAIQFLYTKIILKKDFKTVFGLGDFLFFLVLAVAFPTVTFLVLFAFSILFSAVVFFFLKKKMKEKTVPLAGFQALFTSGVLAVNWILNLSNLYLY